MSRNQTAPPSSTIDPYEYPQIVPNHDSTDHHNIAGTSPIITKDVTLNPNHNTWLRIFLPSQALASTSNKTKMFPLIVYYHGGGFTTSSAASTMNNDFCSNTVLQLVVAVVSVEYRLAPKHRLPVAYDDATEALHWIKSYQVGLRASTAVDGFKPLKMRGLVLHHPFFGGSQRTESELRLVNNPILPQSVSDLIWKLALPIGVDRDHEYCNPTVGGGPDHFDQIRKLGWWVLVIGCDGDPLIDHQRELVEILNKKGVLVEAQFNKGDYHGVELMDATKANPLFKFLSHFIKPRSLQQ
ncbi:hypothetical protein ACB098_10G160200 [Castanea mollissima]